MDFDPTFTFGNVLTTLSFLLGIGTIIWRQSAIQAAAVAFQQSAVERFAMTAELQRRYVPIIDGMARDVQAMTSAINDIKTSDKEIDRELGRVIARLIAIETAMQRLPPGNGTPAQPAKK